MTRMFRRYHRQIAIVLCLPLFLTVLTGMSFTIAHEWLHQDDLGEFLLRLHTLEILHLEKIYPLLNGLGLVGLLITGISMTGLFRTRA
ncbi:peptidase [Nostoc sp. FACHB-973]|uniref:Peptidase n=1 Tax=Desmonostoc muscorum LEGE 12446 TaxID=1828758 RepID=A0A8J6ZXZ8_DESMC|nr:peptidase [Desmonostoc muscorum]MBD2518680.1 peptidase [Nostoc sp. FACHB-973]MBX9253437.1 peptidase [Desmonostoc muscorum CCALA 125]MCF2146956.1 peptidase [Desmonostoc muscorum LEGE 12446]